MRDEEIDRAFSQHMKVFVTSMTTLIEHNA